MEINKIEINKKNKIIFTILAGIISIIFCIIKERQDILHSYLVETSNNINLDLPMIINSDLRFDSTAVLRWNKFAYYYTYYTHSLEDFDKKNFEYNLKDFLINNARTNAQLNNFQYFKITFVYIFKDKDGNEIKEIKITYKEYK